MHTIILKETDSHADSVLGHIFTDVCSKLPTRSHEGFEYFVTFIDDKSRKVSVQGLQHNLMLHVTCKPTSCPRKLRLVITSKSFVATVGASTREVHSLSG